MARAVGNYLPLVRVLLLLLVVVRVVLLLLVVVVVRLHLVVRQLALQLGDVLPGGLLGPLQLQCALCRPAQRLHQLLRERRTRTRSL